MSRKTRVYTPPQWVGSEWESPTGNERYIDHPGIHLAQALKYFAGRRNWSRFMRLEQECLDAARYLPEGFVPTEYRSFRLTLERLVLARIESGELVASAVRMPVETEPKRIFIDPEYVRTGLLKFDFETSTASGTAGEYRGVRVYEAHRHKRVETIRPASPPEPQEEERPARPSELRNDVRRMLEEELRRRAENGKLKDSIAFDIRETRKAVYNKVCGTQHAPYVPKAKSVEKH